MVQLIVPYLWLDKGALDSSKFYLSAFPNSEIVHSSSGDDFELVSFQVGGYEFALLSTGSSPFKLNPSISFTVKFSHSDDGNAASSLDALWKSLADGGSALMPLDKYFFSDKYGWINDKFAVSWQLSLVKPEEKLGRNMFAPALMFTGDMTGKADEAIDFYVSIFKNSKRGISNPYPEGQAPEKDCKLMYAEFMLEGQWFSAMDSGRMHKFGFNEAFSFMVRCNNQEEIDHYFDKLSAVPESENCGWLKDKYGVSWQIIPTKMEEMMRSEDEEKVLRVKKAFRGMKKINLEGLLNAYDGK